MPQQNNFQILLPFILLAAAAAVKSVWWAWSKWWDGLGANDDPEDVGFDPPEAGRSELLGGGVNGLGQSPGGGLGGPNWAWSSTLKAWGDSSLQMFF